MISEKNGDQHARPTNNKTMDLFKNRYSSTNPLPNHDPYTQTPDGRQSTRQDNNTMHDSASEISKPQEWSGFRLMESSVLGPDYAGIIITKGPLALSKSAVGSKGLELREKDS